MVLSFVLAALWEASLALDEETGQARGLFELSASDAVLPERGARPD